MQKESREYQLAYHAGTAVCALHELRTFLAQMRLFSEACAFLALADLDAEAGLGIVAELYPAFAVGAPQGCAEPRGGG